jgi:hypothetical protein
MIAVQIHDNFWVCQSWTCGKFAGMSSATMGEVVPRQTKDNACAFNSASTILEFDQCGGLGFSAPNKICGDRFMCKLVNTYYSQCVRRPVGTFEFAPWGQCGGEGFVTGSKKCSLRQQCRKQLNADGTVNIYYSQCIPCTELLGMTPTL